MARPKRSRYSARSANRFDLYEKAVQCPEADVRFMDRVFSKARGRAPRTLREDFCGSAMLCAEWVASASDREAYGVDLDQEVMDYGVAKHVAALGDAGQRVHLIREDVREKKRPLVDVQVAFNFSYWIFKERAELLRYFRAMCGSIKPDGLVFLDIHGGPEAFDACVEKSNKGGFTYVWEQGPFDPLSHERDSFIHFHFPDGTRMRKAFSYNWRVWTCPEIKDLLREAGFSQVDIYWEGTDKETGGGNGVYRLAKKGENDPSWIAYIVASR